MCLFCYAWSNVFFDTIIKNISLHNPQLVFKDKETLFFFDELQAHPNCATSKVAVSAVAGNIFETFVVSEILKSYANEGLDYSFYLYYYRGKDKIRHIIYGEFYNSESEIYI